MKYPKQLALIMAVLFAAIAQWNCAGPATKGSEAAASAPDPELEVKAVQVKAEDWTVSVPISGNLRSKSIVEIKAEVSGRVTETHFEEGDLVRKDQLVAAIDPANYQLAVNQANAALAVVEAGLVRARVSLDHAQREKERADNLLKSGGITEKDRQAAATAVKEAEAQVHLSEAQCEQARSVISIAQKALTDCRIFAPADGRVQRKFLDKGSLVGPGSSLYSIVDNTLLELESPLPAARLSEIRLGQRAVFTTPTFGERRFSGVVSAINPIVESDNRSVKVDVRVENPGGELLSGMFVSIFFSRSGNAQIYRIISVMIPPGAIAFTRIWCFARSLASPSVNQTIALLEALYGDISDLPPANAMIEEMLMMLPFFRSIIIFATACEQR